MSAAWLPHKHVTSFPTSASPLRVYQDALQGGTTLVSEHNHESQPS